MKYNLPVRKLTKKDILNSSLKSMGFDFDGLFLCHDNMNTVIDVSELNIEILPEPIKLEDGHYLLRRKNNNQEAILSYAEDAKPLIMYNHMSWIDELEVILKNWQIIVRIGE